ncbi:ribosomal-processing cysteine protease Prp [Spiroplasma chrysopicola]|uniref:Ribosomal processing cysteine protease Prp n=1 Tax=Spiroplasma chrysopicola DF-1 TaxID=1276227 RepID=R4U0V6_9MOLU|nr:ribosomal-processing cysteine protease Prp [Spiroplasma chrysopicola]AGM24927.1 hypothetical protein SCHRY_v1c03420 [Spiroplasma chrysopicola DF-1]
MIKINFIKTENKIKKVEITGHALQAESGKDLVCAAVTAISTGTLNAIDQIKEHSCNFTIDDGLIVIEVFSDDDILQIILQTMYYQLLTIYQQYQTYIQLKEVEQ